MTPPDDIQPAAGLHDPATLVCPHCGHELSAFEEPEESPADQAAQRLADAIGSWRYMVALCAVTLCYLAIVLIARPTDPDTSTAINYLGVAMTVLVAIQAPLILLAQRRDAVRDRARDQEALRVATRVEYDLHMIRAALGDHTHQHPMDDE